MRLLIIALFLFATHASADEIKWETMLVAAHRSEPGEKSQDFTSDFLGAGGRITSTRLPAWELDVALGIKLSNGLWAPFHKSSLGFDGTIRFFPGRRK